MTNIELIYTAKEQGMLCVGKKHDLVNLKIKNTASNAGFLFWLSDYSVDSIFEHEKSTKYFFLDMIKWDKSLRYLNLAALIV